jgi:hypothetical protein
VKAKTLLALLSASLAFPALHAAEPSVPSRLSKQPPPPVEAGPGSSMKVASPLGQAPAAATAPKEDTPTFSGDPNEDSPDLIARYQRARRLIAGGAWVRAQLVLERAIAQFPDSRHLHQLLAELYWYKSSGSDPALLRQSAREAVQAMDIGLGFGVVDYGLTNRLQQTLGRTGDLITLDRLFGEALAREGTATVYLHYALGLSRLKDPRAEAMFKKAVDRDAGDALASYAEWLLDNQRDVDALGQLPKSPGLYYLHFLRGVALERQNRGEEARAAYGKFRDYSSSFPAPARFRIAGSRIQSASGIHFDDEPSAKIADTDAVNGLSYLIYGEARGENYGGMLAEGWVVRARTLRGSVGSPTCPAVSNTGATLADKYKSVMCQGSGSQFNGVCLAWCSNPATTSCSYSTSTDNAAYDVYYGYGPDPVSGHCPDGISQSGASYCDGSIKCNGNTVTYRLASPLFNLGTSSTCGTTCAPTSNGKICGNGGLDNCFYSNPNCQGVGRISYTGTLSGTGSNSLSDPFYVSASGNFNGHLEGPESQDFDLFLQSSSSSTGPWTDVASSARLSAVEEINYSGGPGYYRWRAYSYNGSGSFSLCTKHP